MWGFFNSRNRKLANHIKNLILDEAISKRYNKNSNSPKGEDQNFLSDYVYPLIKDKSIIHDSYTCKHFNDSKSFPTKRIGNCFIGLEKLTEYCDPDASFYICPIECRQKNKDWESC